MHFFIENVCIFIQIPLNYVPWDLIGKRSAMVEAMEWCHTDNTPLPEPMMTQFDVALTRPHFINGSTFKDVFLSQVLSTAQ